MNYRHAFHAGNFADLVKHALLLAVLRRLTSRGGPLQVIDTHAGAGLYTLDAEPARRSGEARTGVARLMVDPDPPSPLRSLAEAVRACDSSARLRTYPGSPWLAVHALRRGDRYIGCELRADDGATLRRLSAPQIGPAVEVIEGDGYAEAARRLTSESRTLLLIDPPYEQADDYVRTAELVGRRSDPARQPALVWTPLKDLETFDRFLCALEALRPASLLVAQARLQPLDHPLRMNGCAVVMVDAPDVSAEAREVCGWVASRLGGVGACAMVDRLACPAT